MSASGADVPVIDVRNVSKKYRIWHERRQSLKQVILRRGRGGYRDFWALSDVSFQVERGETFGIIGENGSGKSTMLKLLAGIFPPNSGEVRTQGRIAALLELGAGFHPELTGRENVFLNGSILGLSRKQIESRLDDIIAFTGLEDSIDTPVRTYSSGMFVRLGFSVAIHSEPDVLIVDEVLTVGDEAFQRKSADKILSLRESGTTIILVSHALELVRGLCSRAIWLDRGKLQAEGLADDVVRNYLRSVEEGLAVEHQQEVVGERSGTGEASITGATVFGGEPGSPPRTGKPATIRIEFESPGRIDKPVFGIAIHRRDGVHVTGPNTRDARMDIAWIEGTGVVEFSVKELMLLPGSYLLTVALADYTVTHLYDVHDRAYPFDVRTSEDSEARGVVTLGGSWRLVSGGTLQQ